MTTTQKNYYVTVTEYTDVFTGGLAPATSVYSSKGAYFTGNKEEAKEYTKEQAEAEVERLDAGKGLAEYRAVSVEELAGLKLYPSAYELQEEGVI